MSASSDWVRVFDLDDSIEDKRAGLFAYHEQHLREWLEGLVEDGDLPASLLPAALAKAMIAIEPLVDADLAAIVGAKALH